MLSFVRQDWRKRSGLPQQANVFHCFDNPHFLHLQVLAGKHFRDERLSMKGIPPKLRSIIDAYLESKGIEVKVKPISILDDDFQKQVGTRKRTKTKAAEVEHAIRHHYVIIHELAHLIEANHTPRFWNIVRTQAPTIEKAKAWLKEYGQLLEQAIEFIGVGFGFGMISEWRVVNGYLAHPRRFTRGI
ncbi:M48 metallopeptidase family protein [Desulfocucumis palustris]|uniref:M48 metallopeptidase family protein n=1 Tax=Desulfocucumis palustris TaxID=1898651 RepID=UPI001A9A66A5|nr:M48 family metallopeptidase [Desulfocucumis palustris]